MENKICKQCGEKFEVTDDDLAFLKRISPEIGGKKFEFPAPVLCPDCREQRRIAFRNERKLYKRKCSICGREIVSVYSPDKEYKVACRECFWAQKHDPMSAGVDYDPEESFSKQLDRIWHKAGLLSALASNLENSEYVNQETDDKNCYMNVGGHFNEDCYYNTYSLKGAKNIDNYFVWGSNNLYECLFCNNCTMSQYLENCQNCFECYLCLNCIGCNNCFGSVNLNRKQYYFFNEKLDKGEYEKRIRQYLGSYEGLKEAIRKFEDHKLNYPRRFARFSNCENSSGNDLTNCKNVKEGYSVEDGENNKYVYLAGYVKDVCDISSLGWGERCYNVASTTHVTSSACATHCLEAPESYYCSNCNNSRNLFGCVGLNRKQYCILNKQYTKEEYEVLVPKIIEKMKADGEWGEFFPMSISPFGYNETVAMEYFPLKKEEVLKLGGKWQDEDYGIKYDGPFYEPKDVKVYDPKQNPEAQKEIDECVNGILRCEKSGRPFKILPQELAQYIEKNIQLPRRHPDQRHLDRLAKTNPMKLWQRSCMCEGDCGEHEGECPNEFETTYSPERKEKVYCERCYLAKVG